MMESFRWRDAQCNTNFRLGDFLCSTIFMLPIWSSGFLGTTDQGNQVLQDVAGMDSLLGKRFEVVSR